MTWAAAIALGTMALGCAWIANGGPAARTARIGLGVLALGPLFVLLDAAGLAPGAGPGVAKLAAMLGWPLLATGWVLVSWAPEVVERARPVAFVVLLIAAMIDPTDGLWVRVAASAAWATQAVAALRWLRAAPRAAALGVVGAAVGGLGAVAPDQPAVVMGAMAAGLLPSTLGLVDAERVARAA